MVIISDTSVITYLFQLEQLDLLKDLFDDIFIPPKVKEELVRVKSQEKIVTQFSWISVVELKSKST